MARLEELMVKACVVFWGWTTFLFACVVWKSRKHRNSFVVTNSAFPFYSFLELSRNCKNLLSFLPHVFLCLMCCALSFSCFFRV